jgi:L-amino acid N-acyltransferase YncA
MLAQLFRDAIVRSMANVFEIVPASLADAPAVAAIYAHHVLHETASWETVPPDAGEIAGRMAKVLEAGWPWLMARGERGDMLGFAYAGQFHSRAGYRYSCEDSIYLRHDCRGQGIGSRLLADLIGRCEEIGFRQMVAGIAGGQPASIALHARFGFVEVARMPSVGRKHGLWLDLIYMQRALGPGDSTPPPEEP